MIKSIGYWLFALLLASTGCVAQKKQYAYNDKLISYQGRMIFRNDAAEFTWPGTSFTIQFDGTGVSGTFRESDTSNYYNVIVDGTVTDIIHFDTIKKKYQLAKNLSAGKHSLQLFKRTEWDKGRTFFYGLELETNTALLAPAARSKRKIEFYGNSISCGYAIEDLVTDSHIGYFENNYNAYPAITARHFDAQYHCIAKSGIGITISWFPLLMKEMYNRLDPEDSSSEWDFTKYTPDIVVINLLQNDSWLINMPDHPAFKHQFDSIPPSPEEIQRAYRSFVQSVRSKYPAAHIICMLGNMDISRKGSLWPGYAQTALAVLKDRKIYTLVVPFKETPGHPKTAEQQILAQQLIQFIDTTIKW